MRGLSLQAERRARRGRRSGSRGYTVVELLMSLAIFGVGITGVIALQKVTSASNQHARNLALATHVAQSWIENLTADATSWTDLSSDSLQGNTHWLKEASTSADWHLPETVGGFGARFGALGQPLAAANADQTVFCAHLRLTILNSPTGVGHAVLNNGLVRAEVRVFWPRHAQSASEDYCTTEEDTVPTAALQAFHFVYQATALRQSRF